MELTSKERILLAIKNKVPDRVPVMPDFSNMIPCRLTGKPFWDIYLYRNPDLYHAYANAAKYFGIDGWYQAFDAVTFKNKVEVKTERKIVSRADDRIVERFIYHTPKGELYELPEWFKGARTKKVGNQTGGHHRNIKPEDKRMVQLSQTRGIKENFLLRGLSGIQGTMEMVLQTPSKEEQILDKE